MNRNLIFFMVFLFVLLSLVNFNPVGKFYINEPVARGNDLDFYVNLGNNLNQKFDDISVRAFFYDLGEVVHSNSLDLNRKSTKLSRFSWAVPVDTPKGDYLIKLSASNDKFRDSRHIVVEVR